jgi:UDP-3-O-[3-hydroxymyristoyl] glucosamine N-acyltransferase
MMKFTAHQIAEILNGEIVGNSNVEVSRLSKIEEGSKGSITFLSNPKYTPFIYSTEASITIVNKSFTPDQDINTTLIKVDNAYNAFTKLLEYYNLIKHNKTGIESPVHFSQSAVHGDQFYLGAFSYIGDNVTIGDNVKIHPNSYIGDNVTIGDNTIIYAGVKIHSDSEIGTHCIINSNAVIGADGFGFVPNEDGTYSKIPQTGNVIVESHVEIGAATTIDRATLGSTIIKTGVKLDNQIQIAHNVVVGEHTVIAAQTGVAGSTKIGAHCQIGGQVGFAGHIVVGDYVQIQAQSGVTKNVKSNDKIQGSPAMPYNDFYKSYVHFKNLPDLAKSVNSIEKSIK